ncbi:MAG TPA: serine/threonine-protein kinase, partial [Verrucomicrobiae bacterium]|nr:serine/threonine-protein kinase [Verrucomicrobiae bacterium]
MFGIGRRDAVEAGPFGPYNLIEPINRGGMAEIWLATSQKGQHVALRISLESGTFEFAAKQRFFSGCEVLARIPPSPLIAGYIEHGKIGGVPYMAMEYVEGANLKLMISRNDPSLAENVGNILIDMALALEHVHDAGFMHLDFKPENVVLTPNGNIKLVDFDLSRPIPDKPEKSSGNPGTPAYMAPEQLLRQPFDRRVDIFAYGVTAYEVLTFEKPFPGDSASDVLRKQVADRSVSFINPRDRNPEIPFKLEQIIIKCLERDPDKRYPYMSVLVRDLQAALYV